MYDNKYYDNLISQDWKNKNFDMLNKFFENQILTLNEVDSLKKYFLINYFVKLKNNDFCKKYKNKLSQLSKNYKIQKNKKWYNHVYDFVKKYFIKLKNNFIIKYIFKFFIYIITLIFSIIITKIISNVMI